MGLIKYNYEHKGYTLPTAYARVQVNTEKNEATFYIGANRDLAFKSPIEKIKIYGIPFSHENNPLIEAYEFAKSTYKQREFNEQIGKYEIIEKKRYFNKWKDDIVR